MFILHLLKSDRRSVFNKTETAATKLTKKQKQNKKSKANNNNKTRSIHKVNDTYEREKNAINPNQTLHSETNITSYVTVG